MKAVPKYQTNKDFMHAARQGMMAYTIMPCNTYVTCMYYCLAAGIYYTVFVCLIFFTAIPTSEMLVFHCMLCNMSS